MFFDSMPKILYDSKGNGEVKVVTNLLKRVAIRTKIKTNALILDTYNVKNGETPESLAHKLYEDAELHWVILMINDITDRYHQWPMTESQFLQYINDKYDDVDAIHHYEISQESGDTTVKINIGTSNADYPTATAITNFEHEQEQQDAKRKIRLLDPRYVSQFVSEYQLLMQESVI